MEPRGRSRSRSPRFSELAATTDAYVQMQIERVRLANERTDTQLTSEIYLEKARRMLEALDADSLGLPAARAHESSVVNSDRAVASLPSMFDDSVGRWQEPYEDPAAAQMFKMSSESLGRC